MKICIITTTRADFGLLKNLILELKKNKFKIKIIAGGTHYLKRFGNTFREIEKFKIKKATASTSSMCLRSIAFE